MKNLLYSLFISIFTILNTIPIQISAKEEFSNQSIIQPVSDIKIWKYKAINGHVCKRLWNSSRKRWETNWIPC